MAFNFSPKIVTDGLILHLDAANPKSYPGSGTIWTDLSRQRNIATLVNGPTFNNTNGGRLVFDGTNDYGEISIKNTNLEFQPTQRCSAFCWVFNIDGSSTGAIISNMVSTAPFSGWDIWRNGSNTIATHLIANWSLNAVKVQVNFDYTLYANKWVYIGYTYDGSSPTDATTALNSINFYINGNLASDGKANASGADGFNTSSEIITYDASQRFRIASRWASSQLAQGSALTISQIQVYNKTLTTNEVLQNYNATKGRYGL